MAPQKRCVLAVWTLWILAYNVTPQHAYAQTGASARKLQIVIVEGEGAINNVRQRVAREPIIQVEDENRKPVAGAAVTFLLPQQGPGAAFPNGSRSATLLTDNNGRAVARGLRPNNVNGDYQIRVSAAKDGQTANATISQTNSIAVAGAAAGAGISGKLIAMIAVAAAAAAGGVVAAVRAGDDGRPGGAAGSPTVIVPGSPTLGGPQ